MGTFVVAHGAWSSAWAWKRMRPLMRDAGHEFFIPSYTGLGARSHLATPGITLQTHIADVTGVMEFEDLRDVVLVGHSYGGVVATGVADRLAERIASFVYLDAFVPESGQCAFDLVPPAARAQMEAAAQGEGDGWRVPPSPLPPDTPAEDREWAAPRRMPQPIGTLREPLKLSGRPLPPRAYIYCTRSGPGDAFRPYAERARQAGWPTFELDASHNPHITCPGELFALLQRFA